MAGVEKNQEYRVLKEKVEVLNGDRGDGRKAAMRQGDAQDLREFIANLRRGVADVQTNVSQAQKDITSAQEQLGQIDKDVEDAGAAIVALNRQIGEAGTALTAANEAIAVAQAAIDALGDNGASLASRVNAIGVNAAAVTIPPLGSSDISVAPTADDYNDLRADVAAVREALSDLKNAIS